MKFTVIIEAFFELLVHGDDSERLRREYPLSGGMLQKCKVLVTASAADSTDGHSPIRVRSHFISTCNATLENTGPAEYFEASIGIGISTDISHGLSDDFGSKKSDGFSADIAAKESSAADLNFSKTAFCNFNRHPCISQPP